MIRTSAGAAALGFLPGAWRAVMAGDAPIEEASLLELLSLEQIDALLARALARGGDFAEVFVEAARSTRISLEENEIRNARLGNSLGVGIRTVKGDRTGYAYSDDLDMEKLLQAADAASFIAADAAVTATPVAVAETPDRYRIGEPSQTTAPQRKIELLHRANQAGYAADPAVHNVILSYVDSQRSILVADSGGRLAQDVQPQALLLVYAILEDADGRETGFYGDGGRVGFEFFETVTPETLSANAVRLARVALGAEDAPAGPMPVVINGRFGGLVLHEAIGHGMEADFNRRGLSTYSGRLGERVAPEFISIEDNADWDPKEPGTLNIDDEGAAAGRTVLVEDGILRQYMQDRISASVMGEERTGNGRRMSFRHAPMPRMTNTIMRNGGRTPDEIIGSVDQGLFVQSISNGRVDIAAGDFVFFVEEAYLIESGEITRPVKGATLIGNGPEVLSRIELVGDDFAMAPSYYTCGKSGQSVEVGFGMPTFKVSRLTVGGAKS